VSQSVIRLKRIAVFLGMRIRIPLCAIVANFFCRVRHSNKVVRGLRKLLTGAPKKAVELFRTSRRVCMPFSSPLCTILWQAASPALKITWSKIMFAKRLLIHGTLSVTALAISSTGLMAQKGDDHGREGNGCSALPGYTALKAALVAATSAETSGLNNHMWGTIVDRDGTVCAVAFSGVNRGAQWPGSRIISAQKANTANSFSLDSTSSSASSGQPTGLALSTANLYSAVQPGGSLFGLQESNPVNVNVAYDGASSQNGTTQDGMLGRKIGGVNVFGGGLALYGAGKVIVGAVGVSGDTSCADHDIAWRVRHGLNLDHMAGVGGVSGDATRPDNIVYDVTPNPNGGTGVSAGGFGHPKCINTALPNTLPVVQP
jgi:uncharacterized protein GlcG (DUF336 family)